MLMLMMMMMMLVTTDDVVDDISDDAVDTIGFTADTLAMTIMQQLFNE